MCDMLTNMDMIPRRTCTLHTVRDRLNIIILYMCKMKPLSSYEILVATLVSYI